MKEGNLAFKSGADPSERMAGEPQKTGVAPDWQP